ncbi:hypothetical protein ACWGJ9_08330 [Curtobacterium citreum]
MSTMSISSTATTAREDARQGNGKFGEQQHSEAPENLIEMPAPAHEQPVEVTFILTRYADDRDDNGQEANRIELDVRAVLDTMHTDNLPSEDDMRWDPSALEEAVIDDGFIDPDGCSVVADVSWVDEDNPVFVYAESRRAADLHAPLGELSPLAPAKQHEELGKMFHDAYQEVGLRTVMRRLDSGDEAGLRETFQRVHDVIKRRVETDEFKGYNDADDFDAIIALNSVSLTKSDRFRDHVLDVSATLTDRLVNRQFPNT